MPERRGIRVAGSGRADGLVVAITPEEAGWTHVGFAAVRLSASEGYEGATGAREVAIVVIGGRCAVHSSAGSWHEVGGRPDPFAGRPHALYLPPGTTYRVEAAGGPAEIALCSAPARGGLPARLIVPEDVRAHVRGEGQAARTIHNILMEDAPAESLLITEIQSPPGNWSSYPPHKHDRTAFPEETLLEETYYFRFRPAQGFAFQRVYTDDRSLDETISFGDRDVVLVPRGYHVVAAAAHYDTYYLNVLAGPRRALRMSFDPEHEWIMKGWTW
ncbi:MAG: 5-deoxy-glucuronate isomerase [Chloroflexota bacterium]